MQLFNALTGPELKEVLLRKISEQLDLTGEFKTNITYPWVKYNITVKLLSYPRQGIGDTPGIIAQVDGEIAAGGEPPQVSELVVDFSLDEVIDTPDKARVDADLPIPTTAQGPGGVLVDKQVKQVTDKKKG